MDGPRSRARRRRPRQGGRRRTHHSGPLRRAKRPMPHDREEAAAAQRQRRRHAPGVRRASVAGAPPLPVLAGRKTAGAGWRRGTETLVGREEPGSQSPQRVTVTRPRPLRDQPVHLRERVRTRAGNTRRSEHVLALRCVALANSRRTSFHSHKCYSIRGLSSSSLNCKTKFYKARLLDDRRTGREGTVTTVLLRWNGSAHAGGTSTTRKTGTPG